MKRFLAAVAAALLLGGCASGPMPSMFYKPTPEELAAADYGTYPANYQDIVKNFMQAQLKDPESARYRFSEEPRKSYTVVRDRKNIVYIYRVSVFINAKNSYGGYVGEHEHMFDIRNGRVVDHSDMTAALRRLGL